jgi:hypothetical protein
VEDFPQMSKDMVAGVLLDRVVDLRREPKA